MAISHAGHSHPATPAGRAACRKALAGGVKPADVCTECGETLVTGVGWGHADPKHDTHMGIRPRTDISSEGAGPVKPAKKRGTRHIGSKAIKKPGSHLGAEWDLADVPHTMTPAIRHAWAHEDWAVVVGDRFDSDTRKVVIKTPHGSITLVWSTRNPNGIHKVWWWAPGSSLWDVVTVNDALRRGNGEL